MKYQKLQDTQGPWVKGAEIINGTKCRLISEVAPVPSRFTNKDGSVKNQNVGKIKFDGQIEPKNINLNRATISSLVDAFGEESRNWINQPLTAVTEKMVVGGKRVVAVYLLPENYTISEDTNGYVQVVKKDEIKENIPVEDDETVSAENISF